MKTGKIGDEEVFVMANERRETTENGGRGARSEQRGAEQRGAEQRGAEQRGAEQRETRGGGLARAGGMGLGRGGFAAGSPFSFVRRMFEDMDRLWGEFGLGGTTAPMGGAMSPWAGGGMLGEEGAMRGIWAPQIEVFEEGDQLVVRADLPGLKKEDVNVELKDDILTISGERRDERREEREGYFRSERSYGRFARALRVPEGTDPASCEARFENGVLEVRMKTPEEESQRARRIPISTSGEKVEEKSPSKGKKGEA